MNGESKSLWLCAIAILCADLSEMLQSALALLLKSPFKPGSSAHRVLTQILGRESCVDNFFSIFAHMSAVAKLQQVYRLLCLLLHEQVQPECITILS